MMLNVEEHVVSGAILQQAAQSSREGPLLLAIMMDSPYCKERCQALTNSHRAQVISKAGTGDQDRRRDNDHSRKHFNPDPTKSCAPRNLPGIHVQPDWKQRSNRNGLPRRHSSACAFHFVV